MITAAEALALSGADSTSNETWLERASIEISEIISRQAMRGNVLFILSKKEAYHPTSVYAIFDDYTKMELLCSALSSKGYYIKFDNYTLKINCKYPFPVPKAQATLQERLQRALEEFKRKKESGLT